MSFSSSQPRVWPPLQCSLVSPLLVGTPRLEAPSLGEQAMREGWLHACMHESSAAFSSSLSPAWPVPKAVLLTDRAIGVEPKPTASYINCPWSSRRAYPTALLEGSCWCPLPLEWLMGLLKKGELFFLPEMSPHPLEELCKCRVWYALHQSSLSLYLKCWGGCGFFIWSHVNVAKRGAEWWVGEGANTNGQGKPGSCSCLDKYSLPPWKASSVLAAVGAF